MRTANQHEDDAMGFISRAFPEHGRTAEHLAAAQVEAILAVAAALDGMTDVLQERLGRSK
jgi:hypothetical protein